MPIVFMDGFDHYSSDDPASDVVANGWAYASSNAYLNSQVGTRFTTNPGRQIYTTDGNMYMRKNGLTATANMTLGLACKVNGNLTEDNFVIFYENGTAAGNLDINSAGNILVQNSSGTTVETSTEKLIKARWHYIEVSCYSNASGSITVDVDGVNWITKTGIATGGGQLTDVAFRMDDNWFFDDVYITDDLTRLGQPRILTLDVNAQGTGTSNWTGSNTDVDDPGGTAEATIDSTYINSSTTGQTEVLAYADLPTGSWDIKAVRPSFKYYNPDGGSPSFKVTGDNNASTSGIVTTSQYKTIDDVWNHANGSTGGWSETQVDGLEITVEYE